MAGADKTINDLMVNVFNNILKIEEMSFKNRMTSDLSISEVHTIDAIGMYESKTMSEVAKKLDVTVGTLSVAVNTLVKKNYVQRFRCENDRRVVRIELTNKGRLAYRIHQKFHNDMVSSLIEHIPPNRMEVLNEALIDLKNFFINRSRI